MNEYKIVVNDTDVLSCVCGANDSNLKLIEKHLGVPVFAMGTEISVDTDDVALREEFHYIIDRISDEVASGAQSFQDIVASVLNLERHADLQEASISIPGAYKKVYARGQRQADYIQLLKTRDMVFCCGESGTGKTFLAVAEALSLLLTHQKSRIILSRPVMEAGESLGFLPGDLREKISPYLRPLFDAMEMLLPRETVKHLLETNAIEIAPLAYMRGRTLNNSVMILDEAQNTVASQMKMFLTRMGEKSKVFVTGDVTQTDLPRKIESGLSHAMRVLASVNEIGSITLTAEDVVRNPLVKKIVKAYENEKKEG